MSVIHAPRRPPLDGRLLAFPVVTFGLFGALATRLWYFQVVKSPELVERAEASRVVPMPRPAPRGLIVDRNGATLAGVRPQLVVTAVYDTVTKKANRWVIPRVAQMLKADPKKLEAKLLEARRNRSQPMPIFLNAPVDIGARIAESSADLPGIGIDTAPIRSYPDPFSFTHLMGYVGVPSQRDMDRLHSKGIETPAEFVGKGGVEQAYETELMGKAGEDRTETDAKGRAIRQVGFDAPTPGNRLILSLDAKLQRYTTQMLKQKGYVGGVVAIDPNNGEILALVSSPTYDLTMFQGGLTQDEYDALDKDPRHPMVKRPLRSAYSPGSTFKIVTSLAAYRTGKFDPNRPAFCAGGYRLGRRFLRCLGHHGSIAYGKAMAKSCNAYFCDMGMRAGEKALTSAAKEFGLGQETGIDIGGEALGIVPDAAWLTRHHLDWRGGDTLNLSIGQGYLATTPLQMAELAATVANDGVGYRPHLLRAVRPITGEAARIQPEVAHKVDAAPSFWRTLKSALRGVVAEGTARSAAVPGVPVAGKTGSTEHAGGGKTHAWFVGYAPADHPKIAVCVLLEGVGHGGEVAAPIAAEVFKKYLGVQNAQTVNRPSRARTLRPSGHVKHH